MIRKGFRKTDRIRTGLEGCEWMSPCHLAFVEGRISWCVASVFFTVARSTYKAGSLWMLLTDLNQPFLG